MSLTIHCQHLNWLNGKCPECGKVLTLDEKFNATIRNIQAQRAKDHSGNNAPFLDYAEVTMIEMGQEIANLNRELDELRDDEEVVS